MASALMIPGLPVHDSYSPTLEKRRTCTLSQIRTLRFCEVHIFMTTIAHTRTLSNRSRAVGNWKPANSTSYPEPNPNP